jgi:hypothetical protein
MATLSLVRTLFPPGPSQRITRGSIVAAWVRTLKQNPKSRYSGIRDWLLYSTYVQFLKDFYSTTVQYVLYFCRLDCSVSKIPSCHSVILISLLDNNKLKRLLLFQSVINRSFISIHEKSDIVRLKTDSGWAKSWDFQPPTKCSQIPPLLYTTL